MSKITWYYLGTHTQVTKSKANTRKRLLVKVKTERGTGYHQDGHLEGLLG